MTIKTMSRAKLTASKQAALERKLIAVEKELVSGIKKALAKVISLDDLHEIMNCCEELALKWDDRPPIDFSDDDLNSFNLSDNEEGEK